MKGSSFEREVSTALSLWWSNGKRSDIFYRSQASGARFTQRKKAGKDTALQSGDITASDPIGEPLIKLFNIECKTGYGRKTKTETVRWDVLDFLDSAQKETVLEKMWAQCTKDADLTNRKPLLIFRRNGRKKCVMLDQYVLSSFSSANSFSPRRIEIKYSIMSTVIILLDTFLKIINPESIISIYKGTIGRKSYTLTKRIIKKK